MLVTIGTKGLTLQVICYAQINLDQIPHPTPPHPCKLEILHLWEGL